MSDARSNSYALISRNEPFKVIVCLITLVAFSFTIVPVDIARAATSVPNPEKLSVNITIPESLGTIKDSWNSPNTKSIIIHIQDAHCNYYAQAKIAEIIEYLNTKYGVNTVNLEGGAKGYDISIFTDIKDSAKRKKASDYFVKEGLVNGAEYYAINNPGKINLWGAEDVKLYIDNLKTYRNSLAYKNEVDKYLSNLSYLLSNLKLKIYSKELLELDSRYNAYKVNNADFKDYLSYLLARAKDKLIDIKSYTNIYLLSQTLGREGVIDFRKANDQRDELIDRLQKRLSKNALEELVVKTVQFKADKISPSDFYRYLADKAKSLGLELDKFPEFKQYILYVSVYATIDKSKITDEVGSLEDKLKSYLFENDEEKELDTLSKNLALMKNMFNISLTRDDYKYYQANERSFRISNYMKFIKREAPLYKIDAKLDENIAKLDDYREDMCRFFEYSFKRDAAFLKNIKYGKSPAVIVTGGFHTENLAELFKKKNIAYVSIIPNFKTLDGYECPYFKILSGEKKVRLAEAVRAVDTKALATINLLNPAIRDEAIKDGLLDPSVVAGLGHGVVGESVALPSAAVEPTRPKPESGRAIELPANFKITDDNARRLLTEVLGMIPEETVKKIFRNVKEFDYPASGSTVGTGFHNDKTGVITVGYCFDPLYFIELALHELSHSLPGSEPDLLSHKYCNGFVLYLLYPEQLKALAKKDERWAEAYEFYKMGIFNRREYTDEDAQRIHSLIERIRREETENVRREHSDKDFNWWLRNDELQRGGLSQIQDLLEEAAVAPEPYAAESQKIKPAPSALSIESLKVLIGKYLNRKTGQGKNLINNSTDTVMIEKFGNNEVQDNSFELMDKPEGLSGGVFDVGRNNLVLIREDSLGDGVMVTQNLQSCTGICVRARDASGNVYYGLAHIFKGNKDNYNLADDIRDIEKIISGMKLNTEEVVVNYDERFYKDKPEQNQRLQLMARSKPGDLVMSAAEITLLFHEGLSYAADIETRPWGAEITLAPAIRNLAEVGLLNNEVVKSDGTTAAVPFLKRFYSKITAFRVWPGLVGIGLLSIAIMEQPGTELKSSAVAKDIYASATTPGRTFYVSASGNDSNSGAHGDTSWKTIQNFAKVAKPGDTLIVHAGTYAGAVFGWDDHGKYNKLVGTPSAPITIKADPNAPPGSVIINSRNDKTQDGINFESGSSYVIIEGFTINNSTGSITRAGIRITGSDHMIVRNNVTDRNGTWGIFTGFAEDVIIENNTASNSAREHGIYVSNSADRPIVRNNIVYGNAVSGIQLNGDASMGGDGIISGALIENNVIHDNGNRGAAINLDGVQDSIIRGNLLYNNHASGIALFKQDGARGPARDIIVNNTVVMAENGRWAIRITRPEGDITVTNNILFNKNMNRGGISTDYAREAVRIRGGNNIFGGSKYAATYEEENDGKEIKFSLSQWQSLGHDANAFTSSLSAVFKNAPNGDYHLFEESSAVGKGRSIDGVPKSDIDGVARPSGRNYDIGAYELKKDLPKEGAKPAQWPSAGETGDADVDLAREGGIITEDVAHRVRIAAESRKLLVNDTKRVRAFMPFLRKYSDTIPPIYLVSREDLSRAGVAGHHNTICFRLKNFDGTYRDYIVIEKGYYESTGKAAAANGRLIDPVFNDLVHEMTALRMAAKLQKLIEEARTPEEIDQARSIARAGTIPVEAQGKVDAHGKLDLAGWQKQRAAHERLVIDRAMAGERKIPEGTKAMEAGEAEEIIVPDRGELIHISNAIRFMKVDELKTTKENLIKYVNKLDKEKDVDPSMLDLMKNMKEAVDEAIKEKEIPVRAVFAGPRNPDEVRVEIETLEKEISDLKTRIATTPGTQSEKLKVQEELWEKRGALILALKEGLDSTSVQNDRINALNTDALHLIDSVKKSDLRNGENQMRMHAAGLQIDRIISDIKGEYTKSAAVPAVSGLSTLSSKNFHRLDSALRRIWAGRYGKLRELIMRFKETPGLMGVIQRMAQGQDYTRNGIHEAAGEIFTAAHLEDRAGVSSNGEKLGEVLYFSALIPKSGNLKGDTREIDLLFLAREGNLLGLEPGLYFVEAKESGGANADVLAGYAERHQIQGQVESANWLRGRGVNVKGIILAVDGLKNLPVGQAVPSELWTNVHRISLDYSVEDKEETPSLASMTALPAREELEKTLVEKRGGVIPEEINGWKSNFKEFGWHSAEPQAPFVRLMVKPVPSKGTATLESTTNDWADIFTRHGVNMDDEALLTLAAYFSDRLTRRRSQLQMELIRIKKDLGVSNSKDEKKINEAYDKLWGFVTLKAETAVPAAETAVKESDFRIAVPENLRGNDGPLETNIRRELQDYGYSGDTLNNAIDTILHFEVGINAYGYSHNDSIEDLTPQLKRVEKRFADFIEAKKGKSPSEKVITLTFIGVGRKPFEIKFTLDGLSRQLESAGENPADWTINVYALDADQSLLPITTAAAITHQFSETLRNQEGVPSLEGRLKADINCSKINVFNREDMRKIPAADFVFFRHVLYAPTSYHNIIDARDSGREISKEMNDKNLLNYVALLHIFSISRPGTILVTEPSRDISSQATALQKPAIEYPGASSKMSETGTGIYQVDNPATLAGMRPDALRDYVISRAATKLAAPAAAAAFAENREERKKAIVAASNASDGRDSIVKIIVGLPEGNGFESPFRSTAKRVSTILAKKGFGILAADRNRGSQEGDENQIYYYTIYRDDPDGTRTKQSMDEEIGRARSRLQEEGGKGRLVLFAAEMDSGPRLLQKALASHGKDVMIVPDGYTDSLPVRSALDKGEQSYPDIVARVVLGRAIAFYYDGGKQDETVELIKSLLDKITADGSSILAVKDGLLEFLKPLKIKAVNYDSISDWRDMQEELAKAV